MGLVHRLHILKARWWGLSLWALVLLMTSVPALTQPTLDSVRVEAEVEALPQRFEAPLRTFYRQRSYRPLWSGVEGTSTCGEPLDAVLAGLDADGLDPQDYEPMLRSVDPTREAVDVACARALLDAAADLSRGRVAPDAVYDDWAASRPSLDVERLLHIAAARGPEEALRSVRPPYEAYDRLRRALEQYRRIEENGGWPQVPSGPVLRLGDEDSSVSLLRDRLQQTGDLTAPGPPSSTMRYDEDLEGAVRRAQARHGLDVDGVVGPATRAALNVDAAVRVQQLALNMERWRWMPTDLGSTYVHINAAGMWLELVEEGEQVLRLRTIVGTRETPTPGFSSRITYAVLSPYWNVPESIARTEIRPQLARDPRYLARHHMRILSNGRIRQDPGPDNPLGPVKFIFENPFGVRLHGTSTPELFDETTRAFSHGCIRVETPLQLAERLLRVVGWDADRIRTVVADGRERWVPLQVPVPLYVAYWTAWVEDNGTVQFRDDLYGRDRDLAVALGWSDTTADRRLGLSFGARVGRNADCEVGFP